MHIELCTYDAFIVVRPIIRLPESRHVPLGGKLYVRSTMYHTRVYFEDLRMKL